MDFNRIFEAETRRDPDRVVAEFVDRRYVLTAADQDRYSYRYALFLKSLGISAGDRVGLWMGNCPEMRMAAAACLRLGAVMVLFSVMDGAARIEKMAAQCDLRVILYDSHEKNIASGLKAESADTLRDSVHPVDVDRFRFAAGMRLPFEFASRSGKRERLSYEYAPTDVTDIIFTSGSTGEKKPVEKTFADRFGSRAFAIGRKIINGMNGLSGRNSLSVFHVMPYYHLSGFMTMLITLSGYRITELTMERFNPKTAAEYLKKHHVSIFFMTPTELYRTCLQLDGPTRGMPAIAIAGGEAMNRHILSTIRQMTDISFLYVPYGSTEAGNISGVIFELRRASAKLQMLKKLLVSLQLIGNPVGAELADDAGADGNPVGAELADDAGTGAGGDPVGTERTNKAGTGGFPVGMKNLGKKVLILKPDSDEDLPEGETGEICAVAADGSIVRTGDLGYRRGGLLYMTDRISNLINRSGEKISPLPIQDALRTLPGVTDAYVCGAADPEYGEKIRAYLETGLSGEDCPSEEEIRERMKQLLPKTERPGEYVFLDHFPLNASGKTDYKRLREEIIDKK